MSDAASKWGDLVPRVLSAIAMLVIGVAVAIVGGVVAVSVWDARPRTGDTETASWDLPARDNDADGDGRNVTGFVVHPAAHGRVEAKY